MSGMDPEIQAMENIVQLEPALRARVLKWANERFTVGAVVKPTIQAAPVETPPARKRGRPRKAVKTAPKAPIKVAKVRTAKPKRVAKSNGAKPDRDANRRLVFSAVQGTLKDGKTDRKAVVEFLRGQSAPKTVVGNLDHYLRTLENKKVIQKGEDGSLAIVQG